MKGVSHIFLLTKRNSLDDGAVCRAITPTIFTPQVVSLALSFIWVHLGVNFSDPSGRRNEPMAVRLAEKWDSLCTFCSLLFSKNALWEFVLSLCCFVHVFFLFFFYCITFKRCIFSKTFQNSPAFKKWLNVKRPEIMKIIIRATISKRMKTTDLCPNTLVVSDVCRQ